MKTADKIHSSEKKKEDIREKPSTGKKLVQARLPFKILSSVPSAERVTSESFGDTEEIGNPSKKRKLNFDESTNSSQDTKVNRKSVELDVKENVSTKTAIELVEVVISDEEENSSKSSDKTDKSSPESEKITDVTNGSVKTKSNKLKFKFQFTNQKKRTRKNDLTKSVDSDDGKCTNETPPHPTKKLKKDEIKDSQMRNVALKLSSVIELISDDDEPMEDSDISAAEDVKSLGDDCIQKKSEKFDSNEEKIAKIEIETDDEDSKTNERNKIVSKENDTDKKNDCSNSTVDDIEESNHSRKYLFADEISSHPEIKNAFVCISKNEFKTSIKKMEDLKKSKRLVELETSSEKENEDIQETDSKSIKEENEIQNVSSSSDRDDEIELDVMKSDLKTSQGLSIVPESNSDVNEKTSSASKTKSSSKLTPGRIKKLKEMEMRREERLKAKEEKDKKLQEEKDQKRKEREEKELQKKKEKEEKEEQKRREKEEKEKKRLAEIEAKNEERRQKEEEKKRKELQKEDEKRRKEEERRRKELEKEEAENKKKREAEAFTKFFVQKPISQQQKDNDDDCSSNGNDVKDKPENSCKFMPFQVKGHMKLAPLIRKELNSDAKLILDKILLDEEQESTSIENLYLSILKSGKYTPSQDTRTFSRDEESSDVIVLEDELECAGQTIDDAAKPQKYKAKFLYFNENQRPPYYGTWRKKSKTIKPRRPFATDKVLFDYEVDSDEEWEEEEPGESLHGSDDEKDRESEDDYEVDNEFFVPHGHLSEEEMQNQDEEEDNSPETQKAKLKLLQQEFAQEMKKKTEKIKPRLIGIVWQDENGNKPESCLDVIWSSLNKCAMVFTSPIVIEPEKSQDTENNSTIVQESNKQKQKQKVKLTEELIKDLICLFHGNTHKKEFLITEFQAYINKKREENSNPSEQESEKLPNVEYSKAMIRKKIEKMAEWTIMQKTENKKRLCWVVNTEYLKKYNLENLTLSNKWTYILEPKRRMTDRIEVGTNVKEKSTDTETMAGNNKIKDEKKSIPVITKFTKVLSKEDKEKQMNEAKNKGSAVTVLSATLGINAQNNMKEIEKNNRNSEKMTDDLTTVELKDKSSTNLIVKKRVPLLMSVPRGQQISQSFKDKLISDFLKQGQQSEQEKYENDRKNKNDALKINDTNALEEEAVPMEVDNNSVIMIE